VDSGTEVRYAGVVVGRALQVRDVDDTGAFVVFAEPLPVGTLVTFKVGQGQTEDERPARVAEVIESANASVAGMRVAFVTATTAASPPDPAPAPKPMAAVTVKAASPPQPAVEPAPALAPAAAPVEPAAASPVPVAMPEGSGSAASPVPVATAEGSGSAPSGAVSAGHPSPGAHDGDGGGRRRRRRR